MPVVDLLHLAVIATTLGIAAWSLISLRASMPRGRFAVFGVGSSGALFGCAALSGEVGLLPPAWWFVVVVGMVLSVSLVARRIGHADLQRS